MLFLERESLEDPWAKMVNPSGQIGKLQGKKGRHGAESNQDPVSKDNNKG